MKCPICEEPVKDSGELSDHLQCTHEQYDLSEFIVELVSKINTKISFYKTFDDLDFVALNTSEELKSLLE